MNIEKVQAAVRDAGFAGVQVVDAARPPRTPGGVWVVVVDGERLFVGAMGRGSFGTYDVCATMDDLMRSLAEIASPPPTPTPVEMRAVEDSGTRLATTVREASVGSPAPLILSAGVFVDVIGFPTKHCVFAARTPLAMRSQPPVDLDQYHLYEVAGDVETVAGIAAPAFEQPGGGAMLQLARPVLWYVNHGMFRPVVTEHKASDGDGSGADTRNG